MCEKSADCRNEKLQLRLPRRFGSFMFNCIRSRSPFYIKVGSTVTVIINESLNISHNLCISLVCIASYFEQILAMFLVDRCRLGMEDERYSEEALSG